MKNNQTRAFLLTFLGLASPTLLVHSLLSVQEPKPPNTFEGPKGVVWFVALSPDGKPPAPESDDKKIKLWDTPVTRQAEK